MWNSRSWATSLTDCSSSASICSASLLVARLSSMEILTVPLSFRNPWSMLDRTMSFKLSRMVLPSQTISPRRLFASSLRTSSRNISFLSLMYAMKDGLIEITTAWRYSSGESFRISSFWGRESEEVAGAALSEATEETEGVLPVVSFAEVSDFSPHAQRPRIMDATTIQVEKSFKDCRFFIMALLSINFGLYMPSC